MRDPDRLGPESGRRALIHQLATEAAPLVAGESRMISAGKKMRRVNTRNATRNIPRPVRDGELTLSWLVSSLSE